MEFTKFVRKPFTVEAVQVTEENIEEVAKIVGKLEYDSEGVPVIVVNNKKIPYISRVTIGYWLTKVGPKYRCYKDEIFVEQYEEA